MSKVLLVDAKTVKAKSVIEENADNDVLSKVIFNAQEIYLKQVLGSSLYQTVIDEAAAKIADSTYVIPEQYRVLLYDYIEPFLIHVAVADFIAINNYKISNKGVQKLSDNSSTGLGSNEIEYLKNYYDNYVSIYKKNLIKFLKDNKLDASYTDTNITSPATGWLLESRSSCGESFNYESLPDNPLRNEADPFWEEEKANYYNKSEIDALLALLHADTIDLGKFKVTGSYYYGGVGIGVEYL